MKELQQNEILEKVIIERHMKKERLEKLRAAKPTEVKDAYRASVKYKEAQTLIDEGWSVLNIIPNPEPKDNSDTKRYELIKEV